ncbi:MAG: cytochrome c peroxidase [Luteolibacter sp.]|uniref:cytochrome-c peroxidase n=1 Tax=Luteolibacter sp. TaxID=1962973 RepID=UPI003265233C
MKRSTTFAIVAGSVGLAAISNAQLPTSSSLAISPGGAGFRMELSDPGNHAWRMEQSANLRDWTLVTTTKVHNGRFIYQWAAGSGNTYYRAGYDANVQNLTSTLLTAVKLAATPANYSVIPLPPHLLNGQIAGQNNTPATNPTTDPGAELGRVLFYDKRLSFNQTVSCSSCHQAEHGFSDPRPFSPGFAGGLTSRNSMGLTSARYYVRGHFFWDERANTLEDQVLQPIQNSVEMGMTLTALNTRLAAEPFYADLFQRAFGTTAVTSNRISLALAQFVRSIVSYQTKFDQGVPVNFSNFTSQENLGRQIFNGQVGNATCNACHGSDNFVPGNVVNNNGLENPYIDKGIGELTGLPQDEGLFKVPSLRNIALTAPYMHDGRFATLEQVVEFYNSGVVAHPNLSVPLRAGPPPGPGQPPPPAVPLRLNLTAGQKAALVDFLKTLTDTAVTTDPKFQDPFNYGQ